MSNPWVKCDHCPRYYVEWRPGFKDYHLERQVMHEMGQCVPKPLIGPTELFYGGLLLVIFCHWLSRVL